MKEYKNYDPPNVSKRNKRIQEFGGSIVHYNINLYSLSFLFLFLYMGLLLIKIKRKCE